MRNNNNGGNAKRPWNKGRGGGRGFNRKNAGRGKGQGGSRPGGRKEDKKIYQFVPFTSHNASTHHTFSDTKQAYVQAVSLKLGDYAADVRTALDTEKAYSKAEPVRGQGKKMTLLRPEKTEAPENEAASAKKKREAAYATAMLAYENEKADCSFDQSTLDMKYKLALSEHEKRIATYDRNIIRAFDLLMSQFCSDVIKDRLESQPDYDVSIKDNPIEALKRINVLAHNPTRGRYHYACIYESLERLLNIQQMDKESVLAYKDRFEQNVDVLKSYLPTSLVDPYVESTDAYSKCADSAAEAELKKKEEEKFLTYIFVKRSNQKVYGSLMKQWNSAFAQTRDEFPKGLEEAKDVLSQHKSDATDEQKLLNKVASKSGNNGDRRENDGKAVSDTQQDTSFAQKSSDRFCYCCGSVEHLSFDCSKKNTPKDQWYVNKMHSHAQHASEQTSECQHKEEVPDNIRSDDNKSTASGASTTRTWYSSPPPRKGDNHCQIDLEVIEYLLLQGEHRVSIRDQIILDTGSTMDLFCNMNLLDGQPYLADRTIEMATNAGYKVHRYQGIVPGFPEPVWFDPTALTNIMSMSSLRKHHDVAYDSAEDTFIISLGGRVVAKFRSNDKGLYVFTPMFHQGSRDESGMFQHRRSDGPDGAGTNLLVTVEENARFYTRRQLQDAKRARELRQRARCDQTAGLIANMVAPFTQI